MHELQRVHVQIIGQVPDPLGMLPLGRQSSLQNTVQRFVINECGIQNQRRIEVGGRISDGPHLVAVITLRWQTGLRVNQFQPGLQHLVHMLQRLPVLRGTPLGTLPDNFYIFLGREVWADTEEQNQPDTEPRGIVSHSAFLISQFASLILLVVSRGTIFGGSTLAEPQWHPAATGCGTC